MSIEVKIQKVLSELVGLTCERAENPHGSILSIDLGPLGLSPTALAQERMHGFRHLTILSPWRLENEARVIVDWNVPGGAGGRLAGFIAALVGKKVTRAESRAPGWDLDLRWSDGSRLRVFSDSTENRKDSWFILGTDGAEVGAGPAVD